MVFPCLPFMRQFNLMTRVLSSEVSHLASFYIVFFFKKFIFQYYVIGSWALLFFFPVGLSRSHIPGGKLVELTRVNLDFQINSFFQFCLSSFSLLESCHCFIQFLLCGLSQSHNWIWIWHTDSRYFLVIF
jgi:hypothetical protein